MSQQIVTQGHTTAASVHYRPRRVREKQQRTILGSISLRSSTLRYTTRVAITDELSFLKPYQYSIHSFVLVGSTAYGTQTSNSDIDIVIITTPGGYKKICEVLFEKEIDDALNSGKNSKFEYTVLSSRQTEKLFQISSPFASAIRHGAVIQDDGYLLLLRNKRFPLLPEKEYYTTCLYENIATPYYGMLKKLQSEARERGCSSSCRRKKSRCEGLLSAHMFANLVMRMLYVTLPSRGMVPLTKADVVTFAKKAYGSQGENVAQQVVSLMHDKRSSFCFDEFKVLKKFAAQLFKEILSIIGLSNDVRGIIVDAVRIARGDHQLIRSPAMKNCVI